MTAVAMDRYTAEAIDPDCLDPAEAAALLEAAPWRRLVVLGDSVAAGTREPTPGYRDANGADRVAELLAAGRPDFGYRNLAVPGLRLDAIRRTQVGPALDLEADLAIVAAGGNDALGRSFDERRVAEGLMAIVGPLAVSGALVVTLGLFDLARSGLVPAEHAPLMAERFDRLDAITRDVVTTLGGIHVENHTHPRSADPAIFSSDRVHCNARGHAIWAGTTVRALSARLRGVSPAT
jgi:lysophospholipase L1-like esterase